MSGEWLRILWETSWQGAVLGLLVLAVQWVVGLRMAARWRFALWFVVLVRLSMVPLPESRLSVFNWMPVARPEAKQLATLAAAPRPARETKGVGGAAGIGGEHIVRKLDGAKEAGMSVANHDWNWRAMLLVAYAVVACVMAGRLILASIWLKRVIRGAVAVKEQRALAIMERARAAMKVRGQVQLLVTDRLAGPALVGAWRPRLAMPTHVLEKCGDEELRFVFLHELAHLKRRDVVLNYWMAAVGVLHWFNPLAWLFLWRMRADRELACDEMVMEATGEAAGYGKTLLKLLELSGAIRRVPGALGMIEGRSVFERRIRMIAGFKKTPAWVMVPTMGLFLTMAAGTLTSAVSKGAEVVVSGKKEESKAVATSEPSADEILQIEIKRLQEIPAMFGDEAMAKEATAEVEKAVGYLKEYMGKPMPELDEQHSVNGTGTDATKFIQLAQRIWNQKQIDIHVVKQPLSFLLAELQRREFENSFAFQESMMVEKTDPRPFLVGNYRWAAIKIDWKTMAMAGVGPDTAISVDAAGLDRLRILCKALENLKIANLVLEQGDYPDFAKIRVVYNVRDLLAPVPSKKAGRMSEAGTPDELIKAIKTSCSPEWWKEEMVTATRSRPRHENAIVEFKGIMTVTTTAKVHGEIAAFLDSLRQADIEDGSGPDLSKVVKFEVGASRFENGDSIEITEVRGPSEKMDVAGIYQVKGKYTLSSQDRAELDVLVTPRKPAEAGGPTLVPPHMAIHKGAGEFTLEVAVPSEGWPHVVFFPTPKGGASFGEVYFGCGEHLKK